MAGWNSPCIAADTSVLPLFCWRAAPHLSQEWPINQHPSALPGAALGLPQPICNTFEIAYFLVNGALLPTHLIQGVESRYGLYGLDAPARSAIKKLWPTIAPHLDQAVGAILDATAGLVAVGPIVAQHRDFIKRLELS